MDNKTINQLIGNLDIGQLRELVGYIVNRNESAQMALLDYCQKKENDKRTDNHDLIIEKQIKKHWSKAYKIIQQFDMYGGGPDDEEEEACDELEAMCGIFEEHKVSWVVRKEILDEMLTLVASDNSGFTDYLMDIAVELCIQKEEVIYLADYLVKYASSYYRKAAAEMYLNMGEDDKFLEAQKANLQYSSDYLELAEYYKQNGDNEQALQTVLEGLEKADGRLDEIYEYLFKYYKKNQDEASLEKLFRDSVKRNRNQDTITELMYQYFKEKGDYEKQKTALIRLFSCANSGELHKLYRKCSRELKEDDFRNEEHNILKTIKNRNLSVYFDILMDKNELKEAVQYLIQNQTYQGWGMDHGHHFSKRLSGIYPREVVEMYWKEAAYYVSLGKRDNYKHVAGILKEIRTIMKGQKWSDEWETRYKRFLEEHRRKKLLLEELKGFK